MPARSILFEGFIQKRITTEQTTINVVYGGQGDPLLLLHGYPQTHVCWHLIAPILAERFTVVCADLRGCGDSARPPSDPEHLAYSKRLMAQDQVEVMENLGFSKFAVVGHDRGARVAHRMALDHRNKVTKLALLDIIPTSKAFASVDQEIATAAFNWFFSIQPQGFPERLIGADPAYYLRYLLEQWSGTKPAFAEEAVAEYVRCFDEASIHATCEEFRAAATIDLAHDKASSRRKILCPTLVLWSATGMWTKFGILKVWKSYARDVHGFALDGGHFLPEENPRQTAEHLIRFLS